MPAHHRRSRAHRAAGAFTLIELLLVVAILATLSGIAVVTMQDVDSGASLDVARHELQQVREAVLRFKADTGFLPKRGPFNLDSRTDDRGTVALLGGQTPAWFDAPANLSQLFERPSTSHALATWSPDRRRGWNGPYLRRDAEGWVAVSDRLATDGTSDWLPDTTLLPAFPAVADPFTRPPVIGLGFEWTTWSGTALERHGRPILLLDVDPGVPGPTDDVVAGLNLVTRRARLVSLGPDGTFSPVVSSSDVDGGVCVDGDDLGLFLLR